MSKYTEYTEKAEELGKLINTERTARGLKPLYMTKYLNECAVIRASEASVYWSHTRPDGQSASSVINQNIVDWAIFGENLAAGSESAESTLNQWRNSQNHWNAIISGDYTHIGIGVIYNPNGVNGVQWFWCTIFTSDFRGDDYEYEGQYLPGNHEEQKIIGAFENAEKLRKIVIPESVKKIGENSFSGTALESVKIASDCEYSESSFPEGCEIGFYE